MCGRFLLDADYEELIERYQIFEDIRNIYDKKTEIFPSDSIWAIAMGTNRQVLLKLTWGITAVFDRKEKLVINGRSETVESKAFFHRLAPCLIPASGYYEWHQSTKAKYKIYSDTPIITFAGLYDPQRETALILTREAERSIAGIHPRMPVMLSPEESTQWLKNRQCSAAVQTDQPMLYAENLEKVEQLSFFD
jgi:putative SOS response-associated peptidase YedK